MGIPQVAIRWAGLSAAFVAVSLAAAGFDQERQPPEPVSPKEPVVEGPARDPAAGVVREIDAELERLRESLDRIDGFRKEFDDRVAENRREVEATEERVAEMAVALRVSIDSRQSADGIYETLVSELATARQRLREALDTLRAPSEVPTYEPQLNLATLDVARFRIRVDTARQLAAELAAAEGEARVLERQGRWAIAETRGRLLRRLNDLRIECLGWLSPALRDRVLGISREGIGQLTRELDHAVLTVRLYRETRLRQLRDAKTLARDVFIIGALSYAALRLALVIVTIVWIRARWRIWLDRSRRRLFRRARTVAWKRRTDTLLALAEAVLPWTLYLVAVAAIKWAITPAVTAPEFAVLYEIALIYGIYRLAVDLFVALVVRIAHRYGLRMAAERRAKLLGTVRWVMRVIVPVVILLRVAELVVGRGYLYHDVVRFSWLILVLTLAGAIVSWRDAAAETYLRAHPTGRLSALVRSTRSRWYGTLITPVCFLWTAGRALAVFARDLALGFEQTRKALAFVFRQRIERQAEARGYAPGDIEVLPESVVAAFTEEAVSDDRLKVDHFPGLEQFQTAFDTWRDTATGGAILLTGERGSGKTTWLHQAQTGEVPKTLITLDRRPASSDELAKILGGELVRGGSSRRDLERLSAALLEGPRRVVIIDLAQHLFLAAVGGYAVFDAFASLVEATRRHVFWVCAMSAFAWQHLSAVRSTRAVFRQHVALGGWSEERIRELIRTRVDAAGVRLNYSDLVLDRLEGVPYQARLIESEEGYTRLLWDYSDGNPRVALHFFLRSLVPESEDSFRVRLFRAPAVESFESLGDRALFTLAATISHENLSLEETATVTRYPVELCRIHLDRLIELGVLRVDGDRHRVTSFWHRAAVRQLRRKNLIYG
jgi:hypothetical protein